MHSLIVGGAMVLGVLSLMLIYLVLKAAHSRPDADARHSHSLVERIVLGAVTKFLRGSLRLGVQFGPMMMLTIRGRTSGLPRTNPVDLWEGDGHRYLVATHSDTAAWVRNLRAAGQGVLWLGRRRWTFAAIELPPADGGAVIKDVLVPHMRRPLAGFVLRQTVQVPPRAAPADFAEIARSHPVFEVTLTNQPTARQPARGAITPEARTTSNGEPVYIRSRRVPTLLIVAGLLVTLAHLTLGLSDVLSTSQWLSGVALGLLVAGIGNHARIFGRRQP
jgi:deazaflavin-dependent oxidoreductase (nitroreductase family)